MVAAVGQSVSAVTRCEGCMSGDRYIRIKVSTTVVSD